MPDDIEKLRLELDSKRVDNEHRAEMEEPGLREKELDAAHSRAQGIRLVAAWQPLFRSRSSSESFR